MLPWCPRAWYTKREWKSISSNAVVPGWTRTPNHGASIVASDHLESLSKLRISPNRSPVGDRTRFQSRGLDRGTRRSIAIRKRKTLAN